ncbi:hypothetical protein HK096_002760, partial [Nowakowskiella sp. JEL0078]
MSRGFWVSKHSDVSKKIMGNQKRSNLIGTWQMEVPYVMSRISPIVFSNPSDGHTAVRSLLISGTVGNEAAKARIREASKLLAPIIKEWLALKSPLDKGELSKIVCRCLTTLLFGEEFDPEVLKSVVAYQKNAADVLLPRFAHTLAFYSTAKTLSKHSKIVSKALPLRRDTEFIAKAADNGIITDDACDTVTDLLLFAGVVGTSHLVTQVCKRLDENRAERLPLFKQNPTNFVFECSRLNPPVTSFTTICSEPTVVNFRGRSVEVPIGTPIQAVLSNANIDPEYWGEDANVFKTERDYSKLVTWNGLLSSGPRVCPGYDISKIIALELGKAYTGVVSYKVKIFTGLFDDASSSSEAFIQIFGTLGKTGELAWPHSGKHQKGEIEVSIFHGQINVGEILSISLWRKDALIDISPNWYVNKLEISIEGDNSNKKFIFPLFGWVPNSPFPIFEGHASISVPKGKDSVLGKLRSEYLLQKQKDYLFVTNHKSLGEWGSTLPTTIKLSEEGDYPLAEKPLTEEISDFHTAVLDAIANAGLQFIIPQNANTIEEYVNNIKLPDIIVKKQDIRLPERIGWRTDESFARLMIAGLNPVELKVIKELPSDFAVTDEMLPAGRTLAKELQDGHLFMLDNDFMLPLVGSHVVGKTTRFLAVPFSLFHADISTGLKLMPVAIQLERARGSPVFTPKDSYWDWFAAKMFVLNCHFQTHQFRPHALWCHLLQEPIIVSLNRMLHPSHPIYKLLHPHFHGLVSINSKARGALVADEDHQSLKSIQGNITSVGSTGNIKIAQLAYEKSTFEQAFFRNCLEETGILNDKAIGDHPFRDDGLLMIETIETYVNKIVNAFYLDDKSVASDFELQSWANDLITEGKVRGFPGNGVISTKKLLSYICANVIFTASALHSAVNFAQIVFAGNVASMPGAMFAPPPSEKGKLTEAGILEILPPHGDALIQVGLLTILSTNSGDKLGHFIENLF